MSALLRGRAGKVLVARRYLATHAPLKEKDCTSITPPYHALQDKLALVRKLLDNRPLTLAEKILYSHLADPETTISGGGLKRGETYLLLHPQVRGCFYPLFLLRFRYRSIERELPCKMRVHSTGFYYIS